MNATKPLRYPPTPQHATPRRADTVHGHHNPDRAGLTMDVSSKQSALSALLSPTMLILRTR